VAQCYSIDEKAFDNLKNEVDTMRKTLLNLDDLKVFKAELDSLRKLMATKNNAIEGDGFNLGKFNIDILNNSKW
jgi:hypothetical protein